MDKSKAVAVLMIGLALVMASSIVRANGTACDTKGCTWLATGTVTRIDGSTIYLLGKDNVVYTVDTAGAEIFSDGPAQTCGAFRVGSVVRVYGVITGPRSVKATRARICPAPLGQPAGAGAGPAPGSQIKIIVEPEPSQAAPPTPEVAPVPEAQPANWFGRGLVTDIDYATRQIRINNSSGVYTVEVSRAQLVAGIRPISLASIGQGDAVRVTGRLIGLNQIQATEVRVVRTRVDADAAVPQVPVSVVGVIRQIDYPSFTFTMTTESTPIVVLADPDTYVQQQGKKTAFMELKPGMRVRMSGTGSLATGFSAKEIQIVAIAP